LRLALPYAGIILSTRETAQVRRHGLDIGVSQISAGSRTNPGGYTSRQGAEQFSLGDHRSLDEVVADLVGLGHIPSFCTGCYRKGRTGHDFMDLAKPGAIQHFCLPNALTSFQEYLTQAASAPTRLLGEAAIDTEIEAIATARVRERTRQGVGSARAGAMDLYV
jgi:2-iminoacetate synthase